MEHTLTKKELNETAYSKIKALADSYMETLHRNIEDRKEEMKLDDNSHYILYRVLGISDKKGNDIDIYQNVGRFLYKYVGSFIEDASKICFKLKYPNAEKKMIPNRIDYV